MMVLKAVLDYRLEIKSNVHLNNIKKFIIRDFYRV